ncbi:DNA gyrase inhibitor YacG [Stieleria varia]|uniref:DNA gyrase inhibitor YacG n=1 Tax=Stieleria varia TaxID=2528005 RepID=A0A5C6ANY7_9BACT|nr:DNA gyrase inhibitor YacG [Stieleria varia]TWU01218.1 DNA gyrase inhibitor YacG [Stieleria varia]
MNPAGRPAEFVNCPVCRKKFLLDETKVPPFCSERCQMVDLGRWLNEDIGVPMEGGAEEIQYRDDEHESPDS